MKKIKYMTLAFVAFLFSATTSAQQAMAVEAQAETYSIKYEWPQKPKVGDHVLKVKVFQEKEMVTDVEVVVSYDMPSMRGHHDTTAKMMQNKKGEFLLPINFAMRGGWEIVLTAEKDGKIVAKEIILLDI
ncbi:MAG: FixH family protein [Alphaproteobacteria bacterium]|nr:FixH family protein [Alphaproteobacteria bacterium]